VEPQRLSIRICKHCGHYQQKEYRCEKCDCSFLDRAYISATEFCSKAGHSWDWHADTNGRCPCRNGCGSTISGEERCGGTHARSFVDRRNVLQITPPPNARFQWDEVWRCVACGDEEYRTKEDPAPSNLSPKEQRRVHEQKLLNTPWEQLGHGEKYDVLAIRRRHQRVIIGIVFWGGIALVVLYALTTP
jgi:hypothetical protein